MFILTPLAVLIFVVSLALQLLALALALTFVGRLGSIGQRISDACAKAPLLDVVVSLFTWIPWVCGMVSFGLIGLPLAIVAQVIALLGWTWIHEWVHRDKPGRRVIDSFLNRVVGRPRNHAALAATGIALPAFVIIRIMQVIAYPMLVLLLNFPRYRHGEWVNCSRQKFEGLVGHDLIWCLYCDWMTGVYSLGAEMLRNVESFWCPIRFYDGKKCENCRIDFPDIDGGWVDAGATMTDVEGKLSEMYGSGRREWFGHPARLTVKGEPVERKP